MMSSNRRNMEGLETSWKRADDLGMSVPTSLPAYLATRTPDARDTVRFLTAKLMTGRAWLPVVGALAIEANLAACQFGALLLLRIKENGVAVKIVADQWAVGLSGDRASLDVRINLEFRGISLTGRPLKEVADIAIMNESLMIEDYETFVGCTRFHCREAADAG